jgi:hypothetical protein
VAWDELKNGARQVVLAHRPSSAANTTWSREVVSGGVPGTYPSIVSSGAGVIVAWSSGAPNSVIRVSATSF